MGGDPISGDYKHNGEEVAPFTSYVKLVFGDKENAESLTMGLTV